MILREKLMVLTSETEQCERCEGTGEGAGGEPERCPRCHGLGLVRRARSAPPLCGCTHPACCEREPRRRPATTIADAADVDDVCPF